MQSLTEGRNTHINQQKHIHIKRVTLITHLRKPVSDGETNRRATTSIRIRAICIKCIQALAEGAMTLKPPKFQPVQNSTVPATCYTVVD